MSKKILKIDQVGSYIVGLSKDKLKKKFVVLLMQGFLAGIFIAFGAIGYLKVSALAADPGVGAFLAAAIFPVGLICILLFGAELFTSNNMMLMGVYNKKYSIFPVLRVLLIVWIANLIGSVFMAGLSSLSGIFNDAMVQKVSAMAISKTTMPAAQQIFSAIICNIIICTAVWIAYGLKSTGAKITVVWFMVTVFILSGTEHIVANMYYLFAALFHGASLTAGGIALSLLFVTIGNFIGGALIVTGLGKLIASRTQNKTS